MWKNGSTASTTSSGSSAMTDIDCSALATRLRWVSITPLALPVVPDEYGSTARCVAASMDTSGGDAPSESRSIIDSWPSAPSSTITCSAPRPTSEQPASAPGSSSETVT